MSKFIIKISFLLLLLIPSLSWGANYQKGVTAAKQGDYATAIKEWTPLAEQGDAKAQYNLGVVYFNGYGVLQNYESALKWYTLAAEQGIASAQFYLGLMYEEGYGVLQNYESALKWYTLAAEQGEALAQYNLGLMYLFGVGVMIDKIYTHMWWNIAAFSGHSDAAENITKLERMMTTADISKAQELARLCVNKNYKDC